MLDTPSVITNKTTISGEGRRALPYILNADLHCEEEESRQRHHFSGRPVNRVLEEDHWKALCETISCKDANVPALIALCSFTFHFLQLPPQRPQDNVDVILCKQAALQEYFVERRVATTLCQYRYIKLWHNLRE